MPSHLRPNRRKNRKQDKKYLNYIASQPCCVTGERPATVHHVRSFGSVRDDRRTIPLVARLHMLTNERPGEPCIEKGKQLFEKFWGIDIEAEIGKHQRRFTEANL